MLLNEAPLGAEDTSPGREPGVATNLDPSPGRGGRSSHYPWRIFLSWWSYSAKKTKPGSRSVLLAC